jgi:hypothetical protein
VTSQSNPIRTMSVRALLQTKIPVHRHRTARIPDAAGNIWLPRQKPRSYPPERPPHYQSTLRTPSPQQSDDSRAPRYPAPTGEPRAGTRNRTPVRRRRTRGVPRDWEGTRTETQRHYGESSGGKRGGWETYRSGRRRGGSERRRRAKP